MEQPQAVKPQNEVLDGPVAILWDIENCPVPNAVHAEDVACNIRMALRMHPVITGAVTKFAAYGDFNAFSIQLREGCQRTGVKLVDVPNGRKDAADKAILIDMFLFALDNRPPSTILLISGDGDFAAALHILGQRGYTIVVVTPSRSSCSALRSAGRFVWNWETVVRGGGSGGSNMNYNRSNNPDIQNGEHHDINNSHGNVNQKLTDSNLGFRTDCQNGEHTISQANIDQMHSYTPMNLDISKDTDNEKAEHAIVSSVISQNNHNSLTNISKNQSYFSTFSEHSGAALANPTTFPHFQNRKQGQTRGDNIYQLGQKQGVGFIKNQLVRILLKFGGCMVYRQVFEEYKILCGRDLCLELAHHGIQKPGTLITNRWSNTFFFLGNRGRDRLLCLRKHTGKHVNQHKNPTESLIPSQLVDSKEQFHSSELPKCQPQSAIQPEPGQQPLQGQFEAVLTAEQGLLCLRKDTEKHVNQHENLTESLIPSQLVDSKEQFDSSELAKCRPQSAIQPEQGEQPLHGQFEAVLTGEQGLCQAKGGDGSHLQCPHYIGDHEEREEGQDAPSLGHEGA